LVQQSDSPFGYHILIAQTIEKAIRDKKVERYHFALFRNLLEKTATYLGYEKWQDCIKTMYQKGSIDVQKGYERRINLFAHNAHSALEPRQLQTHEQNLLEKLFNKFLETFQMKVK